VNRSGGRGAGRPPGSKNVKPVGVRITPTVRIWTREWLNNQSNLSQGKAIDMLVAQEIERQRGE
jgi:hypothetical protein